MSLLMVSLIISGCSSKDDECTKMMAIPHYYVVNNQFQSYDVMEEVPCDFPEPGEIGTPPELKNFSYEVIFFTYIPDTGNNTSQLKFQIKLNNPNAYAAEGLPFLTIKSEEIEFTRTYGNEASIPCGGIPAKGSCTLTFDKEYPIDPDLGVPGFMELVSVKYYVAN